MTGITITAHDGPVAISNEELDDIVLALRSWVYDLSEPINVPSLDRKRRAKMRKVEALADRLRESEIWAIACHT